MSCLKLYWPQTLSLYHPGDSEWSDDSAGPDEPVILAFRRRGKRGGGRQIELLARARMIYANRYCPECGRAAVVPVDSEAVLMSGNQLPVPGSGHLVGFECDCCGHAWEIEDANAPFAGAHRQSV